jgi:hypothetical protein
VGIRRYENIKAGAWQEENFLTFWAVIESANKQKNKYMPCEQCPRFLLRKQASFLFWLKTPMQG